MKHPSWHTFKPGNIPPKRAFLIENECVVLTIYWNLITVFQKSKVIYNDQFLFNDSPLFCC